MISSKVPKSFSGARDLVVFYDFLWFFGVFFRLSKIDNAPPSRQPPLNSSETCLKSDDVLIKFWEKSKVPFFLPLVIMTKFSKK